MTIGVVLASTAFETAAQEADTQRFRDWEMVRADDGTCAITTQVLLRARKTAAVAMTLMPPSEPDDGAVMVLAVPNGAGLAHDIAYRHPGSENAVGLAWQYCEPETCLASGEISELALDRLKRGRTVEVGFHPLADSRSVTVPVSLRGLTAAWRAMQTCEAD